MATRYKDRITILEDAEIEELYGRAGFTHDDRVHYFALTPEERAVADGHYSLASRVLFILQAGYFMAKTLFFSFDVTALEWEFVANLAPMFKTHLRPVAAAPAARRSAPGRRSAGGDRFPESLLRRGSKPGSLSLRADPQGVHSTKRTAVSLREGCGRTPAHPPRQVRISGVPHAAQPSRSGRYLCQ